MILFPSLDRLRNRGRRGAEESVEEDAERARTYPPPFPAGWYHLLDADQLRHGRARRVVGLGARRVVFRGDPDGRVATLDEHCPHLGASLHDAPVVRGCVECPFHRWRFATDGRVCEVPYEPAHNPNLRTRAWPTRELHGMVLAWHGPGPGPRGAPAEPRYEIDAIPDIADGRLVPRGTYDGGLVRMHLLEFADNSADSRHFAPLHGDLLMPFVGWRVPLLRVEHRAGWTPDPERPHVAWFDDDAHLRLFGRDLAATGARARITFFGPGSVTLFRIHLPELGDIVFFQTHLPVAPLLQHVRFRAFADPRIPRALLFYVVGNWIAHWRRDVRIWEAKIHRPKPMLVPSDGPIPQMRRWFRQFYEEPDAAGLPVHADDDHT